MQDIIIEKPYRFIPPHRGEWIPNLIQRFKLVDKYLNYFEGVTSHEVRGAELLRESLHAGHGIILAPNHCRYADPLAMGWIAREAQTLLYAMASWHLFHQGWLQRLAIRVCGGFSIFREGLDRTSLNTAIEIVASAERPLVLFPEGTVFRVNDRINPLLDGVSFLARSAARKRAKSNSGHVVIHPVAIKYLFAGDVDEAVEPVIKSIEQRLTWNEPARNLDLRQRLERIGEALLALRETQHFGQPQTGTLGERKERLIEQLLAPIEVELLGIKQSDAFMLRIKQLRTIMLPILLDNQTTEKRRQEIWQNLTDIYDAQIVYTYPQDYLDTPTVARLLETAERFDEDIHDTARIHRPLHAIMEIGEPIEVSPDKPPRNQPDPIMCQLQDSLQAMLNELALESPLYTPK